MVSAPCTPAVEVEVQGERLGRWKPGIVAGPQSRESRSRPLGAPPDQEEPRVPQPGLFLLGMGETSGFRPWAPVPTLSLSRSDAASRYTRDGLLWRRPGQARTAVGFRRHPLAAGCSDLQHVVSEQADQAVVDRCQQAAGDEEPRFRLRVTLAVDVALRLRVPDQVGEEVVVLADLGSECGGDTLAARGLRQRLDPQVDQSDARFRAGLHVRVGDRAEAALGVLLDRLVAHGTKLLPRLLEAREVEVALRAEVAVEDRLGDLGGARDLRRRRAAVARAREDVARRVEDRLPALRGTQPQPRRRLLRALRHPISGTTPGAVFRASWWLRTSVA